MILLKMKNLLKTLSLNHNVYFMNLQEQDKYQEATDQVASSDNLDNEEQINNSFLHS